MTSMPVLPSGFGIEPPRYVNGAQVRASQWDLSIEFQQQIATQLPDGSVQAAITSATRIIMSPQHAKVLAALLAKVVD